MCRCIGEYISLELFYFVNLTSSCSFIPLEREKKVDQLPVSAKRVHSPVLLPQTRVQVTEAMFDQAARVGREG